MGVIGMADNMADTRNSSLFGAGWRRLLVARRYVIWLYVINLALGLAATASLSPRIGAVLDSSLYSGRLVHGFDLGTFMELAAKPETARGTQMSASVLLAIAFLIIEIFFVGGMLAEYLAVARLERGRFYAACGENFWNMLRLAILFAIAAAITAGILHGIRTGLGKVFEYSPRERWAFAVQCLVLFIEALALLWVRMWFDLAQTYTVASGERAIRRSARQGWRHARAGGLYGAYFALAVLTAAVVVLGGWFWWSIAPASQVFVSFIILQAILFCTLAIRWWQRALAVAWWERHVPAPVVEPVIVTEPAVAVTPAPIFPPPEPAG